MTTDIVPCNSLTNVEQIKSEVKLYLWSFLRLNKENKEEEDYTKLPFRTSVMREINSKYLYFIQEIDRTFKISRKKTYYNSDFDINNMLTLLRNPKIPQRYHPIIKKIDDKKAFKKSYLSHCTKTYIDPQAHLYEITIPIPIISLLEQRNAEEKDPRMTITVDFLKEITQKNGEDFDTYINNWLKKVIEDNGLTETVKQGRINKRAYEIEYRKNHPEIVLKSYNKSSKKSKQERKTLFEKHICITCKKNPVILINNIYPHTCEDCRIKDRIYYHNRRQNPEIIKKEKERARLYYQRQDVKDRLKDYQQKPEVKARAKVRYEKKKEAMKNAKSL